MKEFIGLVLLIKTVKYGEEIRRCKEGLIKKV
jgi:hypothetical protein